MDIDLKVAPGTNIHYACVKAVQAAEATGLKVHFDFNGTLMEVSPGEKTWDVEDRWYELYNERLTGADRKRKGENMDPLFKFHKLNTAGIEKAEEIAEAFDQLLTHLKLVCPEGREFAIVKTKLEEASFFAKKSMAARPDNQVAI